MNSLILFDNAVSNLCLYFLAISLMKVQLIAGLSRLYLETGYNFCFVNINFKSDCLICPRICFQDFLNLFSKFRGQAAVVGYCTSVRNLVLLLARNLISLNRPRAIKLYLSSRYLVCSLLYPIKDKALAQVMKSIGAKTHP